MGDDQRCVTRIFTKPGPTFAAFEDMDEVCAQLSDEVVVVTTWSGSDLMPPERIAIRSAEILAVQEMTLEAWVWQKHANERHYAQQLAESPTEVAAKAQMRMAEMMERMEGDE